MTGCVLSSYLDITSQTGFKIRTITAAFYPKTHRSHPASPLPSTNAITSHHPCLSKSTNHQNQPNPIIPSQHSPLTSILINTTKHIIRCPRAKTRINRSPSTRIRPTGIDAHPVLIASKAELARAGLALLDGAALFDVLELGGRHG